MGHVFDVITNGFGAMPDYAAQVKTADRWAIAAYIRALQLSEHATPNDVPAGNRGSLERGPTTAELSVETPTLAPGKPDTRGR